MQLISCYLRNLLGSDDLLISVPAGFGAGLSLGFYPSQSLAYYVLWKALEVST